MTSNPPSGEQRDAAVIAAEIRQYVEDLHAQVAALQSDLRIARLGLADIATGSVFDGMARNRARAALQQLEAGQEGPGTIEQIMDAQADLQTALGAYRMYHGARKDDDPRDPIEDRLSLSLARLHKLLGELGHPMYQPAQHPELEAGQEQEG